MTADQQEFRSVRIAIMVFDGGVTEQEAIDYCNSRPDIYGITAIEGKQGIMDLT